MNLPDLMRLTAQPSRSPRRPPIVSDAEVPTTNRALNFVMHDQLDGNWCWAATAASVSQFYWPASTWTQCKVACSALGRTDCCAAPTPDACNQPWTLETALSQTHNYAKITGPISFEQVTGEIDASRPLGARTAWVGGGAHFVVIYGYRVVASEQWIDVADSLNQGKQMLLSEFLNHYETDGTWTHTYFTKTYAPAMPFNTLRLADNVTRHLQEALPRLEPSTAQPPDELPAPATATAPTARSLGLAHPVYTVRLDALTSRHPEPTRSGVRVFEMEADQPRVMFDLASELEPGVRQMSTTTTYLQHFPRAMAAALDRVPADQQAGREARLLRVPALNFEALWVHDPQGENDEVIPFRNFHGFKAHEPVPYLTAMDRLKGAAARVAEQGDAMGA